MTAIKGLVLSGTNNFFQVECDDGAVRRCTIKGKRLPQEVRQHNPLAPGDFVHAEIDAHDDSEAQILDIFPRRNFFARFNEKTKSPQILAANLDVVVCITTPDHPAFRPIFVDRVLVQAGSQDIPVIILINKIDLGVGAACVQRAAEWERLGYTVLKTAAKVSKSMDGLVPLITGKTICVVGQSGVGKTTVLNALAPELNLTTGTVSAKYNKGCHTTTKGCLYRIPRQGLSVIDTPGIKNFSLYGIAREEVALYFPEMKPALGKCKFGLSCSHLREEGCEVQRRLEAGEISEMRFESYLNMLE